jgi:hypothetical protein
VTELSILIAVGYCGGIESKDLILPIDQQNSVKFSDSDVG